MKDIIENFSIPPDEGKDKRMSLSEAVRRFVRPGMLLCFGGSYAFPCAACFEVVRQFWGKNPQFTFISTSSVSLNGAIFVHGNLAKKLITAFTGDSLPSPGPNPVFQRAYLEGKIEIEHWSILTYILRLVAGASGLPFLPTYSIIDSSMEEDNIKKGVFSRIKDPFTGEELGAVRSLNPHITFLHTVAADKCGNGILSPPYVTNIYSALAAKEGVIVTTEKIVSTDFIRKNASLVKIPSENVLAVCEVPFGCHPSGLYPVVDGIEGYAEDQEFVLEARKSCHSPEEFTRWIEEWILSVKSQKEYIKKLGPQRLLYLKGKLGPESWIPEILSFEDEITSGEISPQERIISLGVRVIVEKVIENDYKLMLCGIGASHLATWLAYYELLKRGFYTDIIAEIGMYGYAPRPADPYIFSTRNIGTSKMFSDIYTIMGFFLKRALGVLGAGQIDKEGNINSTVIPHAKLYLVGSGGANDVSSTAREVIVLLEQNPLRFVEKVPYITSVGKNVTTVITQFGIYEKRNNELYFTHYFSDTGKDASIANAKNNCGWKLKIADDLKEVPPPQVKELMMIRAFDPKKYFR